MVELRVVHRYMAERRLVVLRDGRVGNILRLNTWFPENRTVLDVEVGHNDSRETVQVDLNDITGTQEP